MKAILLMFHVEAGTAYAIESLCKTFIDMAKELVHVDDIHISFTKVVEGKRTYSYELTKNVIAFDPATKNRQQLDFIKNYIYKNNISVVFGFDQPVRRLSYKYIRSGGVKTIISYQGAPMSSINSGVKLLLKKLQVALTPTSPDHYIFESTAMAETAFKGRGVPKNKISIVPLGVDISKFSPISEGLDYAYRVFKIPESKKIIYYSGHMEKRKGVSVLLEAAKYLYEEKGRRDFHFLILGNKNGEEVSLLETLKGSKVLEHVTFGGYRDDVHKILPCCYLGAIASIGWDSFTMSSLEISACGLPLLVSRLQGLTETIDENITGFSFEPGNYSALASNIMLLLDDEGMRKRMGESSVQRIKVGFTLDHQIKRLVDVVNKVLKYK